MPSALGCELLLRSICDQEDWQQLHELQPAPKVLQTIIGYLVFQIYQPFAEWGLRSAIPPMKPFGIILATTVAVCTASGGEIRLYHSKIAFSLEWVIL